MPVTENIVLLGRLLAEQFLASGGIEPRTLAWFACETFQKFDIPFASRQ